MKTSKLTLRASTNNQYNNDDLICHYPNSIQSSTQPQFNLFELGLTRNGFACRNNNNTTPRKQRQNCWVLTSSGCHIQCLKVLFSDNECDRTEHPVFWQGLGQGYWKTRHTYITVGSIKKFKFFSFIFYICIYEPNLRNLRNIWLYTT